MGNVRLCRVAGKLCDPIDMRVPVAVRWAGPLTAILAVTLTVIFAWHPGN